MLWKRSCCNFRSVVEYIFYTALKFVICLYQILLQGEQAKGLNAVRGMELGTDVGTSHRTPLKQSVHAPPPPPTAPPENVQQQSIRHLHILLSARISHLIRFSELVTTTACSAILMCSLPPSRVPLRGRRRLLPTSADTCRCLWRRLRLSLHGGGLFLRPSPAAAGDLVGGGGQAGRS